MLGKDIFVPQPAEWLAKTVFSAYKIPVFVLWVSMGPGQNLSFKQVHCEPTGQWKGD